MFGYCRAALVEQNSNSILRKPKRFVLIQDFYALFFALNLKNKKFCSTVMYLKLSVHHPFD